MGTCAMANIDVLQKVDWLKYWCENVDVQIEKKYIMLYHPESVMIEWLH